MKNFIIYILLMLVCCSAVFAQSEAPMLFRQPTMNRTNIVFVFAGDLWRVSRSGGVADRLTSGVGNETNPK